MIATRQPHTDLKDTLNEVAVNTVYVLGAGASMNFFDPSFFKDDVVIGVNSIWKYFPVKYCLFKHEQFINEAVGKNFITIASKHDCGDIRQPLNEHPNVNYIFTHKKGRFGELEENFQENIESVGKDDDIFVSYSSITSAVHLAAYMGAKYILLAGHNCGWIDGKTHINGYADHIKQHHGTIEKFNIEYTYWFEKIAEQTVALKAKLKEVYGCEIYSLSPFTNFRLDGHEFRKAQ